LKKIEDTRRLANDGRADITPSAWPVARGPFAPDVEAERRIDQLLAGMSLEDKVGQVIAADIGSTTPEDVREYRLGTILNGGNSAPGGYMAAPASAWLELADAFWDASMASDHKIPIIWGTDAIHGNSNVAGATIFPHAINLGAARDVGLAERIGAATALEMAVTGLDWTFSPTLAVVQDLRWGRTYESFSSDPALVAKLGAALIRGLQGAPGSPEFLGPGKVAATAKHFVGDGGARDGRDQGDTLATETQLRDIHAAGYGPAVEAGVLGIMASFSSWGERKMHGRADLLTGLLKEHWGFDGLVVGDWNAHGQLPGCTTERCPDALLAGLDLYMAPDSWRGLFHSTLEAARRGVIPQARLDDAIRRVLRLKQRAGLFSKPRPSKRPFAGRFDLLANAEHLALAREAVRKSAVLLKNRDRLLPLRPGLRVLVAGGGADNLSRHCGGWTLSWQGEDLERVHFPRRETLLEGVVRVVAESGGWVEHAPDGAWKERPDAAIVVFGEDPYAEFRGDLETLDYRPGDGRDYELVRRLRAERVPVVVVFLSGRPLWVNPALNACDAFVAAFLPGTQAGALAELLFRDARGSARGDFQGRLPFAWPVDADQCRFDGKNPLFAVGFGLSVSDRAKLARLHERSAATGVDPHTLFNLGAAQGGWTLTLEDGAGAQKASGPAFRSPGEAVQARAVDLGQQESAVEVAWTGEAEGRLVFRHAAVDLTRDVNAACCVALQCVPPASEAQLRVRLHAGENAWTTIVGLGGRDGGETRLVEIPLKSFGAGDADFARVDAVSFEADRPFEIVIARVTIAAMAAGRELAAITRE
jgi:beta-glucosidase